MPKLSDNQHIWNKKELLKCLEECKGIISHACKRAGVGRNSYYKYYNEDPDFRAEADSITDVAIDFVEGMLYKKIADGDTACIIFYMKTKGKHRGYMEKIEHKVLENKDRGYIDVASLSEDEINKKLLEIADKKK